MSNQEAGRDLRSLTGSPDSGKNFSTPGGLGCDAVFLWPVITDWLHGAHPRLGLQADYNVTIMRRIVAATAYMIYSQSECPWHAVQDLLRYLYHVGFIDMLFCRLT